MYKREIVLSNNHPSFVDGLRVLYDVNFMVQSVRHKESVHRWKIFKNPAHRMEPFLVSSPFLSTHPRESVLRWKIPWSPTRLIERSWRF